MTGRHDKIVTPDTDPDRFTKEEARMFRMRLCGWLIESGDHPEAVRCGKASKPGASFGNCDEHDAEMLVDNFPDGAFRGEADPRWNKRPDYQARLDAMIAAHQRNCTDRDCECRKG